MIDNSTSLTLAALTPKPYVDLDNRGLVLCNGPRCAMISAGRFRRVAETLELIAAERRRRARRADHVLGGSLDEDGAMLFRRLARGSISVGLATAAFDELRRTMTF